jgi:hypothetical protein
MIWARPGWLASCSLHNGFHTSIHGGATSLVTWLQVKEPYTEVAHDHNTTTAAGPFVAGQAYIYILVK